MTHWTTNLLCIMLAFGTVAGAYIAARGPGECRARLTWFGSRVRADPVGAVILALFIGGMLVYGGTKTNLPPVVIESYKINLYWDAAAARIIPVMVPLRRVHQ